MLRLFTSVDYTKCFQKSEFLVDDLQFKAVFVEMCDPDKKRVNLKRKL
jgi:hypothetical protein